MLAFATSCFLKEPGNFDSDGYLRAEQEALLGSDDTGSSTEAYMGSMEGLEPELG